MILSPNIQDTASITIMPLQRINGPCLQTFRDTTTNGSEYYHTIHLAQGTSNKFQDTTANMAYVFNTPHEVTTSE